MVAIDFNILVAIWERSDGGDRKDELEVLLRSSPHFESYLKNKLSPSTTASTGVTVNWPVT